MEQPSEIRKNAFPGDYLPRKCGIIREFPTSKKWIGSFAAALGGLDTLVFAGGIGEKAPLIRTRICKGLGLPGIELNKARNRENAPLISADGGRVPCVSFAPAKNS